MVATFHSTSFEFKTLTRATAFCAILGFVFAAPVLAERSASAVEHAKSVSMSQPSFQASAERIHMAWDEPVQSPNGVKPDSSLVAELRKTHQDRIIVASRIEK